MKRAGLHRVSQQSRRSSATGVLTFSPSTRACLLYCKKFRIFSTALKCTTRILTLDYYRKKKSWDEKDMKLYRALQVFCTTFNDFNGSLFTVGFTVALVILPIVYIYIALTFTGLHILVFLVFPALAVFNVTLIISFLPQHSKVGILSAELVRAMKQGARTAKGHQFDSENGIMSAHGELVMKKTMAGFAPLGIRIWFFGVYTLGTTEELMDQMFNNIILLMSL